MQEIILKNKRNKEQEYTIHLFEWCNLSCSFCWQNHNDPEGLDGILNKLGPIEEYLKEERCDDVVFNIMGGEIFADRVFDLGVLGTYKEFVAGIAQLGRVYSKNVTLSWVTNLVTDRVVEIEELLNFSDSLGLKNKLSTSYDRKGRFNILNLEKFKRNVRYFSSRLESVGMLFTKKAIKEIVEGRDPYFKELYNEGFTIFIDYLMPDREQADTPDDEDLFKVFKFLIDNYPKVEPIASWLEGGHQKLSCRSSKLVLPDGSRCQCGNLVDQNILDNFYEAKVLPDSNQHIEDNFLEKYGCVFCEYFDRCQLGCFMQHSFKTRVEFDECVYKKTHRYIDSLAN